MTFPPQPPAGQGGPFPPQPPMPPQQGGYDPYAQQQGGGQPGGMYPPQPPTPPQQGGYDPYAQQQAMYPPQQAYQPMGGQPLQGGQPGGMYPPQPPMPPQGYNPYGQPPMPPQQGGYNPYGQPPQGYPPYGYNPYNPYGQMPPQEIVTQPIGEFGRENGFFTKIKVPAHQLQFDEQEFLRLLAGSISLTKDEKRKIIEAVPTLTQFQITELIRILNEEKQKFSELDIKHKEQLDVLQEQHKREWDELEEEMTEGDKQAEEQAQLDQARMLAQQLQQGQNGQMPPKP